MRYQHPDLEEITIFLQGWSIYMMWGKAKKDIDS
jgi:hypothetical protein